MNDWEGGMDATDVVALVGHLAWPVAVLILLLLLRREVRSLFVAVQGRVADVRTDVRFTREGLELKSRLEVLEGSFETQQIKSDVLATALRVEAHPGPPALDLPPTLLSLVKAYEEVSEPDYARRLRLKNELADAMGLVVLTTDVERRVLAEKRDEVLTLALATAIITLPKPGDDALLLSSGRGVERLHVRFRIAAAFAQLASSFNLDPKHIEDTKQLLQSYRDGADASLVARLDRTIAQLDQYGRRT
jgi:hypothetical protein